MSKNHYYPRAKVLLQASMETLGADVQSDTIQCVVIPTEAAWIRNPHRVADTASIQIPFRDFPFDPRTVRSIRVHVFVDDVGRLDSPLFQKFDANADNATLLRGARRKLRFVGYVDKPTNVFDGKMEYVKLDCRDFTAPAIDSTWTGGAININRSLKAVIRELLDSVVGYEDLVVDYEDNGDTNLSKQYGKKIWTPDAGMKVWDIIVHMAQLAGLISTFKLDILYIQRFIRTNTQHVKFLYGSNVTDLSMNRKLHGKKNRIVKLVQYNDSDGTKLVVTYPTKSELTRAGGGKDSRRNFEPNHLQTEGSYVVSPEAAPISQLGIDAPYVTSDEAFYNKFSGDLSSNITSTSGKTKKKGPPIQTYAIQGSMTKEQLQQRAESIWSEGAMEDIEGSFTTTHMSDADNLDILSIQNADAVQVLFGKDGDSIMGWSKGQAERFLAQTSFDPKDAETLVALWFESNSISTVFYVSKASHVWNATTGYSVDIDFANFF